MTKKQYNVFDNKNVIKNILMKGAYTITKYDVIFYETSSGNVPLKDFLFILAKENLTVELVKIRVALKLLEENGFELKNKIPNMMKKIQDDIWELRPGKNRVLFFHFDNNKFVLLHGFKKKTQKTPKNEINKAKNEINDYKKRNIILSAK